MHPHREIRWINHLDSVLMVAALEPLELLERARHGEVVDVEGVRAFVAAWADGALGDPQMAALCMASCINGMSDGAVRAFTDAIVASGDRLNLEKFGPTGDKQSTGGVGDAVTLVAAPLAATLGVKIAKLSGRGLGHTGGTLDRLSAIPGMRLDLDVVEFVRQVSTVGIAVMGASNRILPTDGRLHGLRDQTGTVESPALVAVSLMSRSIATGAASIVLDVKVGAGGVLPDLETARAAAALMTEIGRAWGRDVRYVLSDMSQPLGRMVGNALEVRGAAEVLRGGGADDLADLSVRAAAMLAESADVLPAGEGIAAATDALESGDALRTAERWVEAQGGDPAAWTDDDLLPQAPLRIAVPSPRGGEVQGVAAVAIGEAARWLGAGRLHPAQFVDPAVGIELHARAGDSVAEGETIATLHVRDQGLADHAMDLVRGAYTIGDEPGETPQPVIATSEGE